MHRCPADRAGFPLSQRLCKKARLLAQERSVHAFITLLSQVILLLCREVLSLGLSQVRFQTVCRIKGFQRIGNLFSLRFDAVLLSQQSFPLCAGRLQCLPFGLQLLCLPDVCVQSVTVLLQRLFLGLQLKLRVSPFAKGLLSGVVFRQQRFQSGCLCGKPIGFRLSGHGFGKGCVQGFLLFRCLLQIHPGLFQRLFSFFQFLRPAELRVQQAEFSIQIT